jgi:hypothetical protein
MIEDVIILNMFEKLLSLWHSSRLVHDKDLYSTVCGSDPTFPHATAPDRSVITAAALIARIRKLRQAAAKPRLCDNFS